MPTVLVVEDEKLLNDFITNVLEREGYKVQRALDGEEALQKIAESKPDVVILDLMLPKVNGFEVYRKIHSDERFKEIPVIICSALGRRSLHEDQKSVLGGIMAYFTKPFDLKDLLSRVKVAVESKNGDKPGSKVIVV